MQVRDIYNVSGIILLIFETGREDSSCDDVERDGEDDELRGRFEVIVA